MMIKKREIVLEGVKAIDMQEVWRKYSEHIAPILATNRQTRIESNDPRNSYYYP